MAAAPPALRKAQSAGSHGAGAGTGAGDSAADIKQRLVETAEKLKAAMDVWARREEPMEFGGRVKAQSLALRLCNAAYLGDTNGMQNALEQAAAERKVRDAAERDDEERARAAAEAEEWTVDVKGHKMRKKQHNGHGHGHGHGHDTTGKDKDKDKGDTKLTPEQERAEAEAAWNAMRARQQHDREAREIERASRPGVVDAHSLVRFQWGEEGVRVVRLSSGRYSFRLDAFGVPAPPLFYACMTGQLDAVRLLKRYKANAGATVLLRWPAAGEIDTGDTTSPTAGRAPSSAPPGAQDTAYGARVAVTAWDVAWENGHHDIAAELDAKRQCRACTSPAGPCVVS